MTCLSRRAPAAKPAGIKYVCQAVNCRISPLVFIGSIPVVEGPHPAVLQGPAAERNRRLLLSGLIGLGRGRLPRGRPRTLVRRGSLREGLGRIKGGSWRLPSRWNGSWLVFKTRTGVNYIGNRPPIIFITTVNCFTLNGVRKCQQGS